MISRRTLLATTALVPFAGLLANCASLSGETPTLLTDANLVLSGIEAVVKDLGTLVPAAVETKIEADVSQVQALVTALGGEVTIVAEQPTVQNIVTLVEDAINLIPPGVLPPPLSAALMAIQVLLPILLSYVGVSPAPATQMRAIRVSAVMTPDGARQILRGLR